MVRKKEYIRNKNNINRNNEHIIEHNKILIRGNYLSNKKVQIVPALHSFHLLTFL